MVRGSAKFGVWTSIGTYLRPISSTKIQTIRRGLVAHMLALQLENGDDGLDQRVAHLLHAVLLLPVGFGAAGQVRDVEGRDVLGVGAAEDVAEAVEAEVVAEVAADFDEGGDDAAGRVVSGRSCLVMLVLLGGWVLEHRGLLQMKEIRIILMHKHMSPEHERVTVDLRDDRTRRRTNMCQYATCLGIVAEASKIEVVDWR